MLFVTCMTHIALEKTDLRVLNETTMARVRGAGADQLETITRDIHRDAVYSTCDGDD